MVEIALGTALAAIGAGVAIGFAGLGSGLGQGMAAAGSVGAVDGEQIPRRYYPQRLRRYAFYSTFPTHNRY